MEFYTKKYQNFEKKELKISGKFNPDFYSESDWQKMGFSEKQSAAIVKYKNYFHPLIFAITPSFNYIYAKNDPNLCQIV